MTELQKKASELRLKLLEDLETLTDAALVRVNDVAAVVTAIAGPPVALQGDLLSTQPALRLDIDAIEARVFQLVKTDTAPMHRAIVQALAEALLGAVPADPPPANQSKA